MSFKLAAQPEESVSEASCGSASKEDEPQALSPLHHKQSALESAAPEGVELVDIAEGAAESDFSEQSTTTESRSCLCAEKSSTPKEEETKGVVTNKSGDFTTEEEPGSVVQVNRDPNGNSDLTGYETPVSNIQKEDLHQETVKSSSKPGSDLKEASNTCEEHGSASGTNCETSSTSHQEELSKDKWPDEMSLQRESSLTQTVESWTEQKSTKEHDTAPSEGLCPVAGIDDGSEIRTTSPSADIQQHLPPAVSVTSSTTEVSQEMTCRVATPSASDKQKYQFESSGSFSEMLDLAGALPLPLETRDLGQMRRKSMPANISALVGSSLAKLSLEDHVPGDEEGNQLEDMGDCVLSEYSGPMPSPADVPSSGDTPLCFLSGVSEVDKDLVTSVVSAQKKVQQQECKEIVPESPQKKLFERKDPPVKATMILEKAVTSGVKPDRLRIPVTSSKDRLSEFRLESGLPGDLKIQAIPEVDIEKDPSREASPIPPDNSFTFTVIETGGKAPPTPTTPKSPIDTPVEIVEEKATKDGLPEVTAKNDPEAETASNDETEEIPKSELEISEEECNKPQIAQSQSIENTETDGSKVNMEDGTSSRLEIEKQETLKTSEVSSTEKPSSEEDAEIQLQEGTVDKDSVNPHISPAVIIIPQAQVEEEADEDNDIEIAEEPQEVMEEPDVSPKANQGEESETKEVLKEEHSTEEVRLASSDQEREDPKPGAEERSDSAQNSDGRDSATDDFQSSPHLDHNQPVRGATDGCVKEDKVSDITQIKSERDSKEHGEALKEDQTGTQEGEEVVPDAAAGEREQNKKEDEDVETGQEVEETSDMVHHTSQAANNETTTEASVVDTDSGLMESQGT